jgi:hypothetical protein
MEIVDIPNQRLSPDRAAYRSEQGQALNVKRQLFAELTDDENARIELAIKAASETAAAEQIL